MVSASHNPFADNGIKLFSAGGRKLSDDVEERLEAELQRPSSAPCRARRRPAPGRGPGGEVADHGRGRARRLRPGRGGLAGGPPARRPAGGRRLRQRRGLGGGAPVLLRSLGVEVHVLHGRPTAPTSTTAAGPPIPDGLQAEVVERGADLGVAFDGDADRVLMADAAGELVDGDQLIAILAIDRHERGALPGDAVVVTVMTNLGFRLAMEEHGIPVVETAVGDRYVLEALAAGLALGGEQSGHVIFRDLATTGDGLLTAVQALDVVLRSGRPLAELAGGAMTRLPQVLRNVRVAWRDPAVVERLPPAIAAVEARLGEKGRVLVRPSGTEPLVRVMVEAPTEAEAEAAADELVRAVEAAAG